MRVEDHFQNQQSCLHWKRNVIFCSQWSPSLNGRNDPGFPYNNYWQRQGLEPVLSKNLLKKTLFNRSRHKILNKVHNPVKSRYPSLRSMIRNKIVVGQGQYSPDFLSLQDLLPCCILPHITAACSMVFRLLNWNQFSAADKKPGPRISGKEPDFSIRPVKCCNVASTFWHW